MSALRLARGATGRNVIVKFEGCYHGHADALLVKAGSGLATFGHPTSAGVPEAVVQHTLVLEYNNVAALDEAFARHGKTIACVMIEPIAGNMNFVRASVPFMQRLRELCSAHGALLVFDEVMTGFRVAPRRRAKPLRARHPRLRARPERVRQGHRRRHAAGGVRRQARGDGAARAARPGLPGRHALGQPGRDRLRPRDPARDRQARLLRCARRRARAASSPACSKRRRPPACRWPADCEGGMFGFFFAAELPQNYTAVMATDKERFNRFFHAMLVARRLPRAGALRSRLRQLGARARRHRRDRRGGGRELRRVNRPSARRRRREKVIRAA